MPTNPDGQNEWQFHPKTLFRIFRYEEIGDHENIFNLHVFRDFQTPAMTCENLKKQNLTEARTWIEIRLMMNTTRYKLSLFERNPYFHIRIGHLNMYYQLCTN